MKWKPSADLSDLVWMLRFSGQYFTFEGKWAGLLRKLQYVRIIYLSASAFLGHYSIYKGGLKETMGIELTYTILGTMVMFQQSHMVLYHKEVEDVVETIRNIRARFQKGTDEEFQARVRNVFVAVFSCYAFFTFTSIIMVIPSLVDVLILSWKNPVAFHLPMALGSLLEVEQKRDWKYFFIILQSNGWMFTSGYTNFGIHGLLCITCYSYCSLVTTFCQSLRLDPKLDSAQRKAYIKDVAAHQQALMEYKLIFYLFLLYLNYCYRDGIMDRKMPKSTRSVGPLMSVSQVILQATVLYLPYFEVIRLTRKVRSLVGFPYFFQNLVGALVICSMLYVMESDESADLVSFVSNGSNLIIVLQIMSLSAFVGQQFTNQSSLMFDALYDFPWYELNPSERSYFVSMIGAAREPFKIHFHQCMPLNAENFMAIMNTSYSYLMFMKSE